MRGMQVSAGVSPGSKLFSTLNTGFKKILDPSVKNGSLGTGPNRRFTALMNIQAQGWLYLLFLLYRCWLSGVDWLSEDWLSVDLECIIHGFACLESNAPVRPFFMGSKNSPDRKVK